MHARCQQQAVVVGFGYILKSPTEKAAIVRILREGDTVSVLNKSSNYYHIAVRGKEAGFIREEGIDWNLSRFRRELPPENQPDSDIHSVNLSAAIPGHADPKLPDSLYVMIYFDAPGGIPIRKKADVNSNELARCSRGDKLLLMGYNGGKYYRVKYGSVVGYLYNDFLVNNKFAVDTINAFNATHRQDYRITYSKPTEKNYSAPTQRQAENTSTTKRSAPSRTYYTGPRGGVYYINSNGNKVYIKKN
jgi:hypothetical protein